MDNHQLYSSRTTSINNILAVLGETMPKTDACESHSEHRFPAPSPKLCQNCMVTPLKGTLYFRAAVQRRGQRPPKGSGTNMTVEAT